VYNVSQGNFGNVVSGFEGEVRRGGQRVAAEAEIATSRQVPVKSSSYLVIDTEVANLLSWLAEQQGTTPEIALKKAVATAAYVYDITTSQGGKLLVQRKDNSIGEIVLK
jgi:hypothetical protein